MREVNFSIPNANKASVGITTALYDRRALDCTSTLPLINSLNNLAYLTTSSGRIRDILTVDGGIERLVCILKEGRSKDMMEMWKWNLAFQCIVNIGVRGSEAVRTRVVEADMVPVIATILDNYFKVMDKTKGRTEPSESKSKCPILRSFSRSANRTETADNRSSRSRRHAPPPISIPDSIPQPDADEPVSETTPTANTAALSLSSPPQRTVFRRSHSHHDSLGGRSQFSSPALQDTRQQRPPTSSATLQSNAGPVFVPPVRDIDRLPSMIPQLHAELSSQPQSPTTPGAPVQRPGSPRAAASAMRPRRRPSIRHQLSISGSDDDGQIEESVSDESNGPDAEPVVGIQADIVMQDIVDDDGLLESPGNGIAVPDVSSTDDETFSITHRSAADGSTVNPAATPTQGQMTLPQTQLPPPVNAVNATPPNLSAATWYPSRGLPFDRTATSVLAAMPRDEDVLMSLQLLAYVSKYCNLRSYFQQSRLVSRLQIGNELSMLDTNNTSGASTSKTQEELDEEWDNEFVKTPGETPYNIFPLIEKFTAKQSSSRHSGSSPSQQGDMQYWAGVVMRNLCRKDDSRGGIRQCAYWQCGKWEEYTRQFAKCRRCRRTKYCSKECQKGAWGSHRFWCVAAEDTTRDGDPGSSERHHHRQHRSHHHHHHHHHHSRAE
ncbi:MYND-type zinc finger protein samB [Fulvia fulva]|uniref:MYND-type zinc finger protein samB n=1 Tax=Passalora fulva TaxID=5499 RepID=A0A9Q8LB95_PASFU|nr:MYND-type zinc finger protein samB [Fulvia fulva]KAK4631017.1 MYND-type zinc finger protein samB [Fulvia fulva]KAK4633339.1 MYND-type zinc finger protein samB [Fulvia fulva]UJO14186.1 MYND-type zinc finger protein samB [Fulvia fulva]WPV10978.1 MYND-type zinc finger protein samB [Fulvia fulva]WPV25792.1 MYND-type zinc finger protein samB [Fulvia fulva]